MDTRPSVLVVDDEQPIVDAMEAWLTMAGYSVSIARKGREAIELARAKPPAVAVVDLLLDDIPGLAVMNEIRRLSPHTQCIVVTGRAPEQSALAATEVSAYSYVMKPCNADQLLLVIRRALEHGRTLKALEESECIVKGLTENMPGAVIIFDPNRKILATNTRARELLRKDAESLSGSHPCDHLSEEQTAEFRKHFTQALDSGNAEVFKLRIDDTDCRVSVSPFKDARGKVQRLAAFLEH